eukprot:380562-Pelagomonas_calceolata.AAC.2
MHMRLESILKIGEVGDFSNAYMSWLNHHPDVAKVLAKFPAGNIQFQIPRHWFDAISNPTLPSYPMQLIIVWNLNARIMLDSANKDWIQLLSQDVPKAHWLPLDPPNTTTPLLTHQHLASTLGKRKFQSIPPTPTNVHTCALR